MSKRGAPREDRRGESLIFGSPGKMEITTDYFTANRANYYELLGCWAGEVVEHKPLQSEKGTSYKGLKAFD